MIEKLNLPATAAQLRDNRLFAGVSSEVVDAIGADIEMLRLAKDDLLFNEGDPGDSFYLVCEGSICISKLGRAGKQETLRFMEPGNFFGEMALIDGKPRSAQASAAEPTVLGRIDRQTFDRIFSAAPRELHMNFLRCVTERLREVNSHFMTELIRTERLSLVGTMANSIIHDLKNPICIIRSCSDLLMAKFNDPAVGKFTKMINRAVANMLDMTQELLDFARGQSSFELKRNPVEAVVDELHGQMQQIVPANITLKLEADCKADIAVDVGRFARMLLNLAKNSVEAMSSGGTLAFSVRQEGDKVIFRVSDTGCGIPPELQAQIFEPFVTFGKSKGTGLGMAIVKNVVEAHHGKISVESVVGVGTAMEVAIPVFQE